jgi:hypothetical protein
MCFFACFELVIVVASCSASTQHKQQQWQETKLSEAIIRVHQISMIQVDTLVQPLPTEGARTRGPQQAYVAVAIAAASSGILLHATLYFKANERSLSLMWCYRYCILLVGVY